MGKWVSLLGMLCILSTASGQTGSKVPVRKIMTLGVFHFAYPNLDAEKTSAKDQISVLNEPYQTEIQNIAAALAEFKPTVIAVEFTPEMQHKVDSVYALYRAGRMELKKNEVYQLGFRLGKMLHLNRIYCVDDPGRHYPNLEALFQDSTRMARFEWYYQHSPDSVYAPPQGEKKISSITSALMAANDPVRAKQRLGAYLLTPFKYEEKAGDFTGVDFETGRWFNRNLRIFRNIQRIAASPEERILLIIGSEHLNLLNYFFEASSEFELVSPLPYLQKAKKSKGLSKK